MAFADTVGRFHLGLDGVGLLLQGAPNAPAYRITNSPLYGTRFASGDRDYNDLSQWWYFIQTDWSGGFKRQKKWEDDAQFYYSTNVDPWSEQGAIKLAQKQALVNTFTNDIVCANMGYNNQELNKYFGTNAVSSGEPILYEEDEDSLGTFTDIAASIYDSVDVAISHIFTNLETVFALAVGADQTGTVVARKGGVISDITTAVDSVVTLASNSARCGCSISNVAYVFLDNNSADFRIVKSSVDYPTTGADWSQVFASGTGVPIAAVNFNNELYYLVADRNGTWIELRQYDLVNNVQVTLQRFEGVTLTTLYGLNNLLAVLPGELVITIPDKEVWSLGGDGSLTLIYQKDTTKTAIDDEVANAYLAKGGVTCDNKVWWGNLMYDGTSVFNTLRPSTDVNDKVVYPLFATPSKVLYYGESVDAKKVYKVDVLGTDYKTGASNSAFLILSEHDKLQSVDKLLNKIILGFNPLTTGQSVSVYYTTGAKPSESISDWTLAGTASFAVDGGTVTSKTFLLPDGTLGKKFWFRIELASTTSGTPIVDDFTAEYLPMPDYRCQWSININCADEVKDLTGALVETTARELKARLMRAWMTKSALDFQDLDYASTALNGAIDDDDTTVTVDSTKYFPEQGRIMIDSEEIFYTGKTPSTFTGCTRAGRGTKAVAHADNAVVHNGYRVLVIDIDVRSPILAEGKNNEYIVGFTLREV